MTKTPIAVLGIDLGKNSCSLVGLDASGAVVLRRGVRRETIPGITAKLPHCMIAMEACCGAHHLGRLLARQGHTIRLMSPEYVRPYVKAQKNDDRDAEGIAEAATRPTMRFVELKTEDQLDLQTLHRVRSRLVGMRTTLTNQLRAILLERGSVFPKGRRKFEVALNAFLADPGVSLAARIRTLIAEIRAEWASLVGPMTATALRAAIGNGSAFTRARDLPAWLGLVPKQHTTGGKPRLLGISRRGNAYLRSLFIHGARTAMPSMAKAQNPTGAWLRGLLARAHPNVAVVALAAKLARIAWATLRRGTSFARQPEMAAA